MRLLLAVSGGIAAYRSCELASMARHRGCELRVVMTRNAARFVGPATFEALSGHPVLLDLFAGAGAIDHVRLAKWAQVACLAPATANAVGKLACGIADDAMSTVWMALPASTPRVVAPAMNTAMWLNPVLQRNIRWLQDTGGCTVVAPTEKRLACGDTGPGALADPQAILRAVLAAIPGRQA